MTAALGGVKPNESGFRSDVEFVMPHEYSNEALNAQMTAGMPDQDGRIKL